MACFCVGRGVLLMCLALVRVRGCVTVVAVRKHIPVLFIIHKKSFTSIAPTPSALNPATSLQITLGVLYLQ